MYITECKFFLYKRALKSVRFGQKMSKSLEQRIIKMSASGQ